MAQVRYLVDDVDAAVEFYKKLGFRLDQQFGGAMAIVAQDDLRLWLAGPQASAARPMPDGSQPAPGGWNRFVLQVEYLGAVVGWLKEHAVAFKNEITEGPGGRQILCADPSGNVMELFQSTQPSTAVSGRER